MATEFEVGGFSSNRTVEGQAKTRSVSIIKGKSTGQLDIVVTGDGVKSSLYLLKEVAQSLIELEIPQSPGVEWTELSKVPEDGTVVTISIGVRADFEEDVV